MGNSVGELVGFFVGVCGTGSILLADSNEWTNQEYIFFVLLTSVGCLLVGAFVGSSVEDLVGFFVGARGKLSIMLADSSENIN